MVGCHKTLNGAIYMHIQMNIQMSISQLVASSSWSELGTAQHQLVVFIYFQEPKTMLYCQLQQNVMLQQNKLWQMQQNSVASNSTTSIGPRQDNSTLLYNNSNNDISTMDCQNQFRLDIPPSRNYTRVLQKSGQIIQYVIKGRYPTGDFTNINFLSVKPDASPRNNKQLRG